MDLKFGNSDGDSQEKPTKFQILYNTGKVWQKPKVQLVDVIM